MNLQQQLLNLRNTVRLLEQAGGVVNASEKALTAMAAQIAAIVRDLPEEALLREAAWRRAQPQVLAAVQRMSDVVGRQLYLQMALATPEQMAWAAGYLDAEGSGYRFSSDAPGAAALRRLETGENSAFAPRTAEAFEGKWFTTKDLMFAGSSPDLLGKLQQRVPDDVRRLVESVQLDGNTLREWFGASVVTTDEQGRFIRGGPRVGGTTTVQAGGRAVPRFASFSVNSIDKQVRAGFLGQVSTEEIARNLIFDEIRGQQRLGVGAVRLKTDARTIARTGLMELSDAAHLEQWRSMEAGLEGPNGEPIRLILRWQWDASMDSRICPSCTALDGREWQEREQVPERPHPQCRCAILPVTATGLALREREGRERVTAVEFTNQAPPAQRPKETRSQYLDRMSNAGWFSSKGRGPSGERWYRRRVERPGQDIADWLKEMATSDKSKQSGAVTLQEYFGGGDAGAKRAQYFRLRLQEGDSAQTALNGMMRSVGGNPNQVRWHKVRDLVNEEPEAGDAKAVLSPRQRAVRDRMELKERLAQERLRKRELLETERRLIRESARRAALESRPRRGY